MYLRNIFCSDIKVKEDIFAGPQIVKDLAFD